MPYRTITQRQSPRVILRSPRRGRFGDLEVLVLEMGLGGAKFEHSVRLDVGLEGAFACGPLSTRASVRHSVLLPAQSGVVYQTGIAFTGIGPRENELLLDLLVHEAQEQVVEWESNLRGDERPSVLSKRSERRSAVAPRFLHLRYKMGRWEREVGTDPNQPVDGVTIPADTPEEEVAVLRKTYEKADDAMRELMRRVATVAILERMRG